MHGSFRRTISNRVELQTVRMRKSRGCRCRSVQAAPGFSRSLLQVLLLNARICSKRLLKVHANDYSSTLIRATRVTRMNVCLGRFSFFTFDIAIFLFYRTANFREIRDNTK